MKVLVTMRGKRLFCGVLGAALAALAACGQTVLVESETFAAKGGWVVDPQFVQQMGSPFLLAHGKGVPVADAVTAVTFPAPGVYRLWVRTRDWVPEHADDPGRFQVVVGGVPAPAVFGTEDDPETGAWRWQDGGVLQIAATNVEVRLRDLTGFEGRCDALAFLADTNTVPPASGAALADWRRAALGEAGPPALEEIFDFVVVGGGLAGCGAAVAAAREGVSVALVQDRPHLGGNASQEIRVNTLGIVRGDIVNALRNTYESRSDGMILDDADRLAVVTNEPTIRLFLNWRAYGVVTNADGRIAAVDARHTQTGARRRFAAPLFADCTGDGWIGYWAGAAFRMGSEPESEFGESLAPPTSMTMGNTLMWNSTDTGSPVAFPAVPWAMDVAGSNAATWGGWNWEYGLHLSTIDDAEHIRDHLFRAIYGNFYNAKQDAAHANRALYFLPYIAGKRESRRIVGDHLLTEHDVRNHVYFEDAVATESRDIDLHFTESHADGTDYRTWAQFTGIEQYYIPFRSLYARDVPNLMMAGRCFSCTHVGLGSPRVMHTGAQMGVAVGKAAALCKQYGVLPRDLYRSEAYTLELQTLIGGTWPARPPPLDAIVDNTHTNGGAAAAGAWTPSTSNTGYWDDNYQHNGNTGRGAKWFSFMPDLPAAGTYQVYAHWAAADNRASNVPVEIIPAPSMEPAASDAPHIRNTQPNTVFNDHEMLVGRAAANFYIRGLLDFDLSAVPDDATVYGATLELTIGSRDTASVSGPLGDDGLRAFVLTEAFNGAAATWNNRDTGTPWSTPGGTFAVLAAAVLEQPPDPASVAAGDVLTLAGTSALTAALQAALASNRLQLIVRLPSLEYAFNARKLYRFASETHADPAYRPRLVLLYSTPSSSNAVVVVNQKQNGGQWNDLGAYAFAAGRRACVVVRTDGTDGYVIADAVAFGQPGTNAEDIDGDGLPNWWERYFFLSETAAVPAEDPDGDGFTNRAEWRTGTDPDNAASFFAMNNPFSEAGIEHVLRWPSTTNCTYAIEATGDLKQPFTNLVQDLAATPPENSYTVTVHNASFFRIRADEAP